MPAIIPASQAKTNAGYTSTVVQEIGILQLAVANAIAASAGSVTVNSTSTVSFNGTTITASPMTNSASSHAYYNVFSGATTDAVKTAEMQAVMDYFTSQGYSIARASNDLTNFYWTISWT